MSTSSTRASGVGFAGSGGSTTSLLPVDAEAEDHTKSYFASIYPPDWDGGYDVDRYPSYGPDWRSSSRAAVAQLEALGVYELAATQEAFTRSRRRMK